MRGGFRALVWPDRDDTFCVAILHVGPNGFLVVAKEGDFPCTGPWHHNGWIDDYSGYYYIG